ncbi:integrase [Pseudomonas sp. 3MA1]|uniref:site-specific integrase n=1 Tax=Pseudomonas sp. 3MA1 TaxID=2699196 RepID=UPI0023DD8F42|nr:site-specific integrase [Pseudomonas sp. 3MA1]MDF2394669.1 integrase [Pseudomonas sp. 3MA1]
MTRPTLDSRGVYQFRRKVPPHLIPIMGKREWKRSLGTKDCEVAMRRVYSVSEECAQAFALAQGLYDGNVRLDANDVQQLAARWFREELARLEATGDYGHWLVESYGGGFNERDGEPVGRYFVTYQMVVDPDSNADIARHTAPSIDAVLQQHKLPLVAQGTPLHNQLAEAFWSHLCDLSTLCLARVDAGGRYVAPPVIAPVAPLSFERAEAFKHEGRTILVVWDAYKTDRIASRGAATDTTLNDYKGIVQHFVELFGDVPISSFTNELAQEYRLKLARTPVSKGVGIRGIDALQQIALADAQDLPRISPATAKKRLRAMSSILTFAKDMGWIQVNPIVDSGVSKRVARDIIKSGGSRRRKDYSRDEIKTILSSPVFVANWRPPFTDLGQALYWMPLLAAYTGARQNELAQLYVRDVRQTTDGVHYLSILNDDVDDGHGRRVKTASSRRDVPLHADLLALGFGAYVASLPSSGQLFPKLAQDARGKFGQSFGRHWGPYLSKVVGLESPAAPMHGFRHAFKTLCRGVGIPDDVHEAITGHSGGTVGRSYGHMPLARMAEELCKFPRLAQEAGLLQ